VSWKATNWYNTSWSHCLHLVFVTLGSISNLFMIITKNYDSFPYSVETKTALFAVNSLVSWQPVMLESRFSVQAFITFVGIDNGKICTVTSQNLKWIDNLDKLAVNFFQRPLSRCCQLFGKSTTKWAGKQQIGTTLAGHIAFTWYLSLWVLFSIFSWLLQKIMILSPFLWNPRLPYLLSTLLYLDNLLCWKADFWYRPSSHLWV